VRLRRNGEVVASAQGGAGGAFLPIGHELPRAPAPELTVEVFGTSGAAAGPHTQRFALLTEVPELTGVTLAGGKVRGAAAAPKGQLESPKVFIAAYREGVIAGPPVEIEPGSFTISAPVPSGKLTLRAWFKGSRNHAVVEGPLSPPVPVLSKAPRLLEAALSGSPEGGQHWQLSASWELDEPVAGCDVKVVQGSSVLLSLEGVASPLEATLSTGPGFEDNEAATPLTLSVTPRAGFSTGPAVEATLAAAPLEVEAFVDDDEATGHWQPPALAGSLVPDAYRLCLLRREGTLWRTVARSQSLKALAGSLPLPPAPADAALYGLGVEVRFGVAWSFAGGVTPLLRAAPELLSARGILPSNVASDRCAVAWRWPENEPPVAPELTGYSVVLLEEGVERPLASVGADTSSAVVELPEQITPQARIAVRALAEGAAGPRGESEPVLLAQPVVLGATYAGNALAVDFHLLGGPAPRFLVTLMGNGNVVGGALVRESPGLVRLASPQSGVAYTVTVAAAGEDGRATGPASEPLDAILVPPALSKPAAERGSVSFQVERPAAGGVETIAYRAEVTLDGVAVAAAERPAPKDGTLTIPVGSQIDPAGSYAVRVFPRAGNATPSAEEVTGPPAELPLLLAAPAVAKAIARRDGQRLLVDVALDASALGTGLEFAAALDTDKGESEQIFPAGLKSVAVAVPEGATTCSAKVRARQGHADGPWSPPVAVPLGTPAVSLVAWDGEEVTLEWAAMGGSPEVERYRVDLVSPLPEGEKIAAVVSATSASLRLPSPGPAQVRVTALAPRGEGPAGELLPVPLAEPVVVKSTTSPDDGKTTVEWALPPGTPPPTRFLVQTYVDGQPQGKPLEDSGTSAPLSQPPRLESETSVAVAARWKQGSALLLGNFGPRQALASAPARLREVDCDGLTAAARWDPVPGATGYRLAVVAEGLEAPVGQGHAAAGATSARFPVNLDEKAHGYSLTIQPEVGETTGPVDRLPLFTPAYYLAPVAQGDTPGPLVVLRADEPPVAPAAVHAYLPEIGLNATVIRIAPGLDDEQPPFTIERRIGGGPDEKFPYLLTIGNAALSFKPADREIVATRYGQLLLEAEEKGATPRGILAIQETIARLMPQSPRETLFYSYGLSGAGTIDLRPGTILRVAFSEYDATPNAKNWSTGYAGGATVDYEVGDYLASGGAWMVGFDAFVSYLTANSLLTVPAPEGDSGSVKSGAAGAADLAFAGFQQPFHRLFVPQNLQAATPPAEGNTNRQFAIAAAATWKEIKTASPISSGTVPVAYFRGRAVVKLCVRVTVDGSERVVPVGTTVGNLLDQLADRPPRASLPLRDLRVERSLGSAVLDPASPFAVGRRERLRLDWGGLAAASGGDALALPVLHGDRIELGAR
jgi:hypothetical protein